MRISILGTSNSVLKGGYTAALAVEFQADNLSSGRVPVHALIHKVMLEQDRLRTAQVIVVDHWVNDVLEYLANVPSDEYRTHLRNFYALLAQLGVPVVNVFFPILNLTQRDRDHLALLRQMSLDHGFDVVDLNDSGFEQHHLSDRAHLKRNIAFTFGLRLAPHLRRVAAEAAPVEQRPLVTPYRAIDLPTHLTIPGLMRGRFETALLQADYLQVSAQPIIVRWPAELSDSSRLVSIGFVNETAQSSGMVLSSAECSRKLLLDLRGYYHDVLAEPIGHAPTLTFLPPSGNDKYQPISGRNHKADLGARLQPARLCNLLFHDPGMDMQAPTPAKRGRVMDFSDMGRVAESAVEHVQVSDLHPRNTDTLVNVLRNTALRIEEQDLAASAVLMRIASLARPNANFIRQKFKEYEARLRAQGQSPDVQLDAPPAAPPMTGRLRRVVGRVRGLVGRR